MRKLIFLLFFCGSLAAQDYGQFKVDFLAYQPTVWEQVKADPVFVPSVILAGTFVVNEAIIRTMVHNGNMAGIDRPTVIVFAVGSLVSLAVYFIRT